MTSRMYVRCEAQLLLPKNKVCCLVRVQCEREICLQDANLCHETRAVELT